MPAQCHAHDVAWSIAYQWQMEQQEVLRSGLTTVRPPVPVVVPLTWFGMAGFVPVWRMSKSDTMTPAVHDARGGQLGSQ